MAQFTTAQVAEKLATDPRTLRKFLRADLPKDAQPGKGSRYMIEGKDLQGLKKRFKAWAAEVEAKREAKAEAPADTPEEAAQQHLEDMGEDREPTAEEIEAMAEVMDLDDLDD